MWDIFMSLFDNTISNNASASVAAQFALEKGLIIDNIFMVKEAGFGFLSTAKTSPYPWMMAACAITPGAIPLCLTFFTFTWIECNRAIYGVATCMGG